MGQDKKLKKKMESRPEERRIRERPRKIYMDGKEEIERQKWNKGD